MLRRTGTKLAQGISTCPSRPGISVGYLDFSSAVPEDLLPRQSGLILG